MSTDNLQQNNSVTSADGGTKPTVSSSVLPPAPCRVKITKCSFEHGWYRNLVGEEFDVDNAGGNYDYVLWEDYAGKRTMWRHIAKSDCEVVASHCS